MAEESKQNEYPHVIKKRPSSLQDKLSKPDVYLSGRKRTVFIDLTDFYECWRSIPSDILFDALLIFPNVSREWVFKPYLYLNPFNHILRDHVFVKLLQWKYEQGLLCIISMNINNINNTNDNIHPFWRYLSDKLTEMEYNPLILNTKYYSSTSYKSEYLISSNDILSELSSLTMKMDIIKEILCESNPSLNVMIKYSTNCNDITNDNDDDNLLEELSEINCKHLLLLNVDSLTIDTVSNDNDEIKITPFNDTEFDDILNDIDTAWNNTNLSSTINMEVTNVNIED